VTNPIELRPAAPTEADLLTSLALRSKAHWGYSEGFMAQCVAELTIESTSIVSTRYDYWVACIDENIVGFFALRRISDHDYDLDALFVEPAWIGKGVGRPLLEHAIVRVQELGGSRLQVQSDPHAAAFYRRCGGQEAGVLESSSIAGRKLPLFWFAGSAER
jgi:GNAT superfamily N-acetyltransferase